MPGKPKRIALITATLERWGPSTLQQIQGRIGLSISSISNALHKTTKFQCTNSHPFKWSVVDE